MIETRSELIEFVLALLDVPQVIPRDISPIEEGIGPCKEDFFAGYETHRRNQELEVRVE